MVVVVGCWLSQYHRACLGEGILLAMFEGMLSLSSQSGFVVVSSICQWRVPFRDAGCHRKGIIPSPGGGADRLSCLRMLGACQCARVRGVRRAGADRCTRSWFRDVPKEPACCQRFGRSFFVDDFSVATCAFLPCPHRQAPSHFSVLRVTLVIVSRDTFHLLNSAGVGCRASMLSLAACQTQSLRPGACNKRRASPRHGAWVVESALCAQDSQCALPPARRT